MVEHVACDAIKGIYTQLLAFDLGHFTINNTGYNGLPNACQIRYTPSMGVNSKCYNMATTYYMRHTPSIHRRQNWIFPHQYLFVIFEGTLKKSHVKESNKGVLLPNLCI